MTNLLSVNNLSVSFTTGSTVQKVVSDVSFDVKKGETFYLKGNLPHYIINKNDTLAKVIWVSTPPIF